MTTCSFNFTWQNVWSSNRHDDINVILKGEIRKLGRKENQRAMAETEESSTSSSVAAKHGLDNREGRQSGPSLSFHYCGSHGNLHSFR
ncbi:hypothetical protein SUGI_0946680 [Cryptomeria japonica]|nr:hypothetical protein SUGI_0946680 [Cryptomeria japonica]